MKTFVRAAIAGVVCALAAGAVSAAGPSFAQLADRLDQRKNTKLAVQENWKSVKGQQVTWSGEVVDVRGGRSKANVYVADKSRPTYKGYNIIVVTHDLERAAKLKRGQRVRFRGSLSDYSSRNVVVIDVSGAELLK